MAENKPEIKCLDEGFSNLCDVIWIMVHSGTKGTANKMLLWQGTQMGERGYLDVMYDEAS